MGGAGMMEGCSQGRAVAHSLGSASMPAMQGGGGGKTGCPLLSPPLSLSPSLPPLLPLRLPVQGGTWCQAGPSPQEQPRWVCLVE